MHSPSSPERGERAAIQALLRTHALAPKKSFGQNFLAEDHTIVRLADLACHFDDAAPVHVLEIGAGLGSLTLALAERAERVVAIERDRDLVPILRERLRGRFDDARAEVVEADAKTFDFDAWASAAPTGAHRVLAGNLPYQLTGPLIQRATESADRFDRAVWMVQKEVADRLAAPPGNKTYGALSVFTQNAFRVEHAFDVRPGSFIPAPRVQSAVVLLTPHSPPNQETPTLRSMVRLAFASRRKTLRNAWATLPRDRVVRAAEAVGIDLGVRGETLAPETFRAVADAFDASD